MGVRVRVALGELEPDFCPVSESRARHYTAVDEAPCVVSSEFEGAPAPPHSTLRSLSCGLGFGELGSERFTFETGWSAGG